MKSLVLLLLASPLLAQDDLVWAVPALPSAPLTLHAGQIEIEAERPDLHAPTGVRAAHRTYEGAWEFAYRYEREDFGGLLDGGSQLFEQDVFDRGYSRAPASHTREVHHFSALYGYSDALSILIDIPWISNKMRFTTDSGGDFTRRKIGMGDLELVGIYRLGESETGETLLNLGLSLPTGGHDEKDTLPGSGGTAVKLPYPLQLGSGTFDLKPGMTWTHSDEETSWGAQVKQVLRLYKNSDDYNQGFETHATAWVARRFREDLSGSLRLAYEHAEEYDGQDSDLDPTVGPTQDSKTQGGDKLHIFLGVNYTYPGGHRFSAEIGGPLFQDLNGPALETDIIYRIGWEISF